MSYSIDLRERVVGFVKNGGSRAEASRTFKVSIWSVYDWLGRQDLKPIEVKSRKRKMDWEALKEHTKHYPDLTLKERADHFGVRPFAISYAFKKMNITHKKSI